MAINFGGLATGMDTEAIISALMEIERQPIVRLENEKNFINSRQKAFNDLDTKLTALMDAAEAIDSESKLNAPSASIGTEGYFTASADSDADLSSYQIEVVSLAQQQKDVSDGYADSSADEFGTGTISLTVAGVATDITIDSSNNSLSGIVSAINSADLGVTASIINDGSDTPYRLLLTGDTVDDDFSLDTSGLSGGTYTAPSMTNMVAAAQAQIEVDGITIYSDSNSFDDAISGVSLEVLKTNNTDETSTLTISSDEDATEQLLQGFVDAYNDIVNFIAGQSDADWGNDAAFRTVKRRMQSLLTEGIASGTYTTLAEIGFETQRDGTIKIDSSTLSDAMTDDYDSVISLFVGGDDYDGISTLFADYLDEMTDSIDGFAATRKDSTDSNLRRIDRRIDSMETRLAHREETLRAQFSAMEDLVSAMSSQGNFLAQQMMAMPTIGGNK
jgi:flagellar hook-associated protein 2